MGILQSLYRKSFFRKKPVERTRRVAIMVSALYNITQTIKDEFTKTLNKKSDCKVIVDCFDSSSYGNINSTIKQISSRDYNLLFTVGQSCTKTALAYSNSINNTLPIVFCAVPTDFSPIEKLPKNATGIMNEGSVANTSEQISRLLSISPSNEHLLFVYDSLSTLGKNDNLVISSHMAKFRNRYSTYDSRNYSKNDFITFIQSTFPRIDTIVLSRDQMTMLKAKVDVIELCNYIGITLISLDKPTVTEGASFGIGSIEDLMGKTAAEKALVILDEPKSYRRVPISMQKNKYNIIFNSAAIKAQKAEINPETLLMMRHIELS